MLVFSNKHLDKKMRVETDASELSTSGVLLMKYKDEK